jgi:hypothetical protein
MESNKYPDASFTGKIIEEDDLNVTGTYQVRAKGILVVHGVEQERIIKSTIRMNKGKVSLNSVFSVLLTDHGIKIPRGFQPEPA